MKPVGRLISRTTILTSCGPKALWGRKPLLTHIFVAFFLIKMSRSFFFLADLVPCFLSLPSLPFQPHSCFLPHRKKLQPLTNQLSLKGPSFPLIQVILHVTSVSVPQLRLLFFPPFCAFLPVTDFMLSSELFLCLLKGPVSSFCCWFSSSLEFPVHLFALFYLCFLLDLIYWWVFNKLILTDSTSGGFSRPLHKPIAWQCPHPKSFENSTVYKLTWL